MLSDGEETDRMFRPVLRANITLEDTVAPAVVARVVILPRAQIPQVRELALIVGDGRRVEEVASVLLGFAARLNIPHVVFQTGMASLIEVWRAGCATVPPVFFDGDDGLHHVDPELLAAVRAQTLETCTCGAHYEAGMSCYLCPNRAEWRDLEAYVFARMCSNVQSGS